MIEPIVPGRSLKSYYDSLYLSPHLDDAALSCGGQIHRQTAAGQAVLVVTIMAGDPPAPDLSPFAHTLHRRWQLEHIPETVAARRAEDVAACRIMGADWQHWNVPDCIYRAHPATGELLYVSVADIFGAVHPAEEELASRLTAHLARLPPHGRLLAPLSLGNHVDHQLTRAAAAAWRGREVWYYEDYPYAQAPQALEAVIGDGREWQSERIPLEGVDLQARLQAIRAFTSQLSSFFQDDADLEKQVATFVQTVGGERLWQRRVNETQDQSATKGKAAGWNAAAAADSGLL